MADVLIIGDGPAGLSAALFLAKKGKDVIVFGNDETPMHAAMLYNYLGIPAMTGSDFQSTCRKQVSDLGARLIDKKVAEASRGGDGFAVKTEDGQTETGKYLLIAAGAKPELATALGLELKGAVVEADRDGRTSVENLYAAGWSVRPDKIQAIISAGDGAAAALDILSKDAGKDIHDFDVVDEK